MANRQLPVDLCAVLLIFVSPPAARRSEERLHSDDADVVCGFAQFAGVAAPTIAFTVRRDREEEMIHRGTQYSRAIRWYVKKTGRYPSRLEDLENTNNIRFLRKRYKDPVTNKDFKILHVGEVQLTGVAGIAGAATLGGGTIPGASAVGAMGENGFPWGAQEPVRCSEEIRTRQRLTTASGRSDSDQF